MDCPALVPPARRFERRTLPVLVAWLGLVLALTLSPAPALPTSRPWSDAICLVCGERGVADGLLNLALFVPLGWIVGRAWGWRRAVVAGLGLTLAIEGTSSSGPGAGLLRLRPPAARDLVAGLSLAAFSPYLTSSVAQAVALILGGGTGLALQHRLHRP